MRPAEFRRQGHEVIDAMADYLESLPDGPVWKPVPSDTREALRDQQLPADGRDFGALLEVVRAHILPFSFGNGHPRFFGWGNPPPAPEGILAELIATTMNPSCAGGDQAAIHLEHAAVRWLAELVGFPGHGALVSGGATGALTGLAAARHQAAIQDGWDDRHSGLDPAGSRLVLYVSDETHSCQHKAAELLGLGAAGTRTIPADGSGGMRIDALRAAIMEDRAVGHRPFCVVASAGTASTGAIDPLASIAELCRGEDLWFHVDASLGGFGVVDPRVAHLFTGLEQVDSIVLDPHKWLSVPIDCAAILVRDPDQLRSTFSRVPAYLRAKPGDEPWLSEYVFDQTRPFRALKLWATLAASGVNGVRDRVSMNLNQASRLADRIRATSQLELTNQPTLNIVTFRPPGLDDDTIRSLAVAVQRGGEVFLTDTRVRGRESLRACFMGDQTTDVDVDRIVPTVLAAAGDVTAAG